MTTVPDRQEKTPSKDIKSNNHHQPLKLITIFLFWIVTLYLALTFFRNYDIFKKYPEVSRPSNSKIENVCKSPECITLAQQLHNWQDISVDPCQDFYKAACGKYNEHTVVQGTRFSKMGAILKGLIGEYLHKNLPTTSNSENAIKTVYHYCEKLRNVDKNVLLNDNFKDLLETVQKFGAWPILDKNWNETTFDLNDMLTKMAEFGIGNFGLFGLEENSHPLLFISSNPIAEPFKPDLEQKILGILKVNNISFDEKLLKKDFDDVLAWKKNIAATYDQMPTSTHDVAELKQIIPSVDFERIIKSLFNVKRKDELWHKIENITRASFDPLLSNHTNNLESILKSSSKRTLANFLIFNFLDSSNYFLTHPDCAELIVALFPLASLRVFTRNYFDKENLEIASGMVEDIRDSLIETFKKSAWLHEETKKSAIQKLKMMKKVIGYPKELEIPGALDKSFESLNLSLTDSISDFSAKVIRFKAEQIMDFVASVFPMHSDTKNVGSNAFYVPSKNQLTITVPYIANPLYDSTYPNYAKIASIGDGASHEIGHGFDPFGRFVDGNGEFKNWWTMEDSAEYDRREQCFIDQYNNYDDPSYGRNLNGSNTIREMIADHIGVDLTWKTYKKLDLSREPSIIGFEDYSTDKLFFRLSALVWCAPRERRSLEKQLTMVHPTSSFRVNGVFSNMKSFAEAYNCPVGSPMNPEKKCELF